MRRRERPPSGRRAGPQPAGGERRPGARAPQALEGALRQAAAGLGLALPATFAREVGTYLDELERWQRVGRLTAYPERATRVRHLVLESLMLLAALPEPASPLLDIGSGTGAPGLIVKLARPDWEVVLIEAARRRANFLRHVGRRLGLEGMSIHWGRAEALATGPLAGQFRTVTMRAVATGDAARTLAAPYLAPGGHFVLPIGPSGDRAARWSREQVLDCPGQLPWRRQFLIIPRAELDRSVSRGTGPAAGPQHRGREPEGRRREDDDGR